MGRKKDFNHDQFKSQLIRLLLQTWRLASREGNLSKPLSDFNTQKIFSGIITKVKALQSFDQRRNAVEKLTAFVIEDNKNLALAFAEALREANYDTEVIYDGKTAKERLEVTTPAIVILDLQIPHIKGKEILNYIRSEERLKDIRVIVATANDREADELNHIADLVLLKPVGFSQLKQLASRLRPK